MSDALTLSRYHVGGMDCSACGAKVDTAVRRLEGVTDVSVSVGTEMMTLTHNGDADLQAVEQAIRRLGYTVTPAGPAGDASAPAAVKPKQNWWQSRRALLVGHAGRLF